MKTKIQKIIIAAAVLFAAGLSNISAIAQESVMTPATAEVYQRPTYTRFGVDFSDPIPAIIESIRTASSGFPTEFGAASSLISRQNDDDNLFLIQPDVNNLGSTNNLLLFPDNGKEMEVGDRFILINGGFPVATVYMYTATGNEFAFAESTGNTAAEPGMNQFFLDEDWAETPQPVAGSRGFSRVLCSAGFTTDDEVNCRPIVATDCGTNDGQNEIPDFWDGSMCVANCPADNFNGNCVDACSDGETRDAAGICQPNPDDNTETGTDTPEPGTETPQTQNPTRRTSGGDSESKAARVIGIVGIGMAMYAIANGGLVSDSFAFSPDFGYDITESGYAINGGGKISYSEGDLQMYWTAKQTNANGKFGDFRYTSGGKYTADIWTATFSESVAGETAKYSFGLSADMDGYFIGISPVYRLHSFYDKDKSETRNELNLQGDFRYNNWQIRPAAGFRWQNEKDFAEDARFSIDAVRRF